MRDEFDDISLKRSLLIADAVGVDLVVAIVLQGPKPEKTARKPVPKPFLQPVVARKTSKVRKPMHTGPDFFQFFSEALKTEAA